MIDKIDGNTPAALFTRPIERTGAGAVEAKLVEAAAAVTVMPTYDFQFRVNTETQEITAVIVDPNTRAVIREIPAKEMHAASDVIRRLIGPSVNKTV
ncbi:MAG: flagellar protein FlaG [Nitrospiraceae bacterium]